MRRKDFDRWLEDSTTREMLELIKEHRDASYRMVTDAMLYVSSLKDVDMCLVAEYRGQVHAFDQIIDTEEFLREKLERKEDEEAHTVRIGSIS